MEPLQKMAAYLEQNAEQKFVKKEMFEILIHKLPTFPYCSISISQNQRGINVTPVLPGVTILVLKNSLGSETSDISKI